MNRAIASDMANVCKDLRQLLCDLSPSQLSDDSTAKTAHAGGMSSPVSRAADESSEAVLCTESMLGAEAQSLAVDEAGAPVGDDEETVERRSTNAPDVLEPDLEFGANAADIAAFNMAFLSQAAAT